MVAGIEKLILNQHFELRIGYLSDIVTGQLFLEKVPGCYSRSSKKISAIFEVLHVGFVKRPCGANIVYCSCVLDARMKTCDKTEGDLVIKCL